MRAGGRGSEWAKPDLTATPQLKRTRGPWYWLLVLARYAPMHLFCIPYCKESSNGKVYGSSTYIYIPVPKGARKTRQKTQPTQNGSFFSLALAKGVVVASFYNWRAAMRCTHAP